MIDKSLFALPKAGMMLGILLVLGLIQAGCLIGQALSLSTALVHLWEGGAVADQAVYAAVFLACFLAKRILDHIQEFLLDGYAHERSGKLRSQLLEGVFVTQAQIVNEAGSASVATSALEGIDQVETYLRVILPKIVHVVAIPLTLLICTFIYDWVSGLVLLILFPVIIFYMIMLGRTAQARAEAQYETYHRMSNHFIDTLRGIDTLKAFGVSRAYGKTIFRVSEDFRHATIDTLKVATLSGAVLDLIATAGVAAVSMLLGFRLINDSMALFNALVVLILAPEYFKPIREFASDFHASLDGKNALVNITNLVSKANAVAEQDAHFEHDLPAHIEPWSETSTLELQSICYARPQTEQEQLALKDINLHVTGTMKVGIVGASGSGKSTLIDLLGGFALPSSGEIIVDRQPIKSLRRADWQNQVLYIPQDPYLFHASLRDNMCFYTPHAEDADVQRAVEMLGLSRLVTDLPDGLNTIIGEGARGLSGGQAQRIALARALLDSKRKVLLFDEPTAHLDIETELELKERMLPLMEGRLVLFATHRLHWLNSMDWVVVLDGGRIVQQGPPSTVLAEEGRLSELAARAMGGVAS